MVDHGRVVGNSTRAVIISSRRITGPAAGVIAALVEEIGPLWHERHQARLAARPRKRAVGAGVKYFASVSKLIPALRREGADPVGKGRRAACRCERGWGGVRSLRLVAADVADSSVRFG
jgi:hypothetical protein